MNYNNKSRDELERNSRAGTVCYYKKSLNIFFETYLVGSGKFYFPQLKLNKCYHIAASISGSTSNYM